VDLATPAYYEWPVNKLIGDIYKSGALPLWNPYQAAGMPLAAEYSTRAFFPYQILENASPVWMWDYFILGRLLIAGFFSFLFLTRVGLSFSASLLGGIFYMFSGTMVWFINLEQMTNVAMMLPVLLYSLELMVLKPGGIQMAILGVVCALVLLGGQPEVAFYILFLAVAYFTFRALQLQKGKAFFSLSIKFMFALALGMALAAPQTLPFLEFVSSGHHVHHPRTGIGTETILNWKRVFVSLTPTATEIPADPEILPEVLTSLEDGIDEPTYFRIFATKGVWDWIGGYTGVFSVFMALVGVLLVLVKRSVQGRGMLLFFFCFGAVILLKHFGVRPFLWLGLLPIFDIAWGLRWASPTWVFSLSMAGAIGFHAVVSYRRHADPEKEDGSEAKGSGESSTSSEAVQPSYAGHMHKYLVYMPTAVFIAFVGIYLCILLPDVIMLSVERNLHFSPLSAPYIVPSMLVGHIETILILTVALIITLYYVKSGKGVYGFIGLAVLELWWAIPRGYDYRWLYLKSIPFLVGLILVFSLWKERWRWAAGAGVLFFLSSFFLDATAPKGFPERYNPFTEPPYVEFLRGKEDPFRVMGGYGVLYPNYASSIGLQDMRYISALMIPAYQEYRWKHLQEELENEEVVSSSLWFTGRPERVIVAYDKTIGTYFKVVRRGVEEDIKAGLPYYSLLGVRYILMPSDFTFNDTGSRTDTPDLPLIYDKEIRIYENPGALPRSFITNDFRVVSPGDVRITPPGRGAAREPYRHRTSDASRLNVRAATIEEYRPNKVSIQARLEHPGLLVLSDVYYRGWEAYVDDKRTKIYRVNRLVRGVFLREGTHRVEFRYRPKSLTVGAAMGAIGLIAIVSLLLPSRRYPEIGHISTE
jgi:hypothetical protein